MWCALIKNKIIGPFSFEEPTVTDDTFLPMVVNDALLPSCLCLSGQKMS